MNPEQFTFPFGVGMMAAVNPCGFTMLPTYLGYFIGIDNHESKRLQALTRAIWVAVVLTAGFVAVFGGIGVWISLFLNQTAVVKHVGYITITVGLVLVAMGVAMLFGQHFQLRLPQSNKAISGREMGSMFGFGVSYAVVSLSCTIGLFVNAVSNAFTTDGFWVGIGSFVAYGLGMGSVVLFVTVGLARARSDVAGYLRRVFPQLGRISGCIVVVGGIYLIDYGIWDVRVLQYGNTTAGNLFVDGFLEFQATVGQWITETTPKRIGVVSVLGVSSLMLLAWREDNPDKHVQRKALTALFVAVYLAVEAAHGFDFVALPLWRFVSGWPERVGHWFTDPSRWGVPLEILLAAMVLGWAGANVDRYRQRRAEEPAGSP